MLNYSLYFEFQLFKDKSMHSVDGFKENLLPPMIKPAVEKTRSTAAEDAGTNKISHICKCYSKTSMITSCYFVQSRKIVFVFDPKDHGIFNPFLLHMERHIQISI